MVDGGAAEAKVIRALYWNEERKFYVGDWSADIWSGPGTIIKRTNVTYETATALVALGLFKYISHSAKEKLK